MITCVIKIMLNWSQVMGCLLLALQWCSQLAGMFQKPAQVCTLSGPWDCLQGVCTLGWCWISVQYPQLGLQTVGLFPGVLVGTDFPQISGKSPAWSLGEFLSMKDWTDLWLRMAGIKSHSCFSVHSWGWDLQTWLRGPNVYVSNQVLGELFSDHG